MGVQSYGAFVDAVIEDLDVRNTEYIPCRQMVSLSCASARVS